MTFLVKSLNEKMGKYLAKEMNLTRDFLSRGVQDSRDVSANDPLTWRAWRKGAYRTKFGSTESILDFVYGVYASLLVRTDKYCGRTIK